MGRKSSYDPAVKAAARERYERGVEDAVICHEVGIKAATLRYWASHEGWRVRVDNDAGRGKRYAPDIVERARMLYVSGLSARAVGERLGVPAATIDTWQRKKQWTRAHISNSRDDLLKAIGHLAAQSNLTRDDSLALDKLTRSLDRLDRAYAAERRDAAKAQSKIPKKNKNGTARSALLSRALAPDYGLYPYQRAFLLDDARFRATVKSRQIGFSYIIGLDAVLTTADGKNAVVFSASQDQSDLVISYAQHHAERLGLDVVALSRSELILDNGAKVIARPANVRTGQGFSGSLYLDEFAWVQHDRKLWEAVVPTITAVKGRLTVCSTPYDQNSLFYQLIEDPDNRYQQFSRHRITLAEAVAQGLPVDIEELRGLFDSDAFARLYECQWFDDAESYYTTEEVKACVGDCLQESTEAVLHGGYDVGRTTDASELTLVEAAEKVSTRVRKTFKRMPFADQKRELISYMTAYSVAEMNIDATGMGLNLSEDLKAEYPGIVNQVWFTQPLKEELAINLKKLFEDKKIVIPCDPNLIAQIHAIKRIAKDKGFSYDSGRNKKIGHADAFWSLALACRNLGFTSKMLHASVV